ncbi:MAG: addiction module protein [Actinomycetota bacterium]|nr:addiction module protein [Actinomycetota bacterium]
MTIKTDELISMVESLPVDIKTKLVEKILDSLHPSQKEIDELWAKEAERRIDEIKMGKVKTISGEDVFKEINQKLAK